MKRPIAPELFEAEIRFTEVYKQNINSPPAIREALCLRERIAVFEAPAEGDVFAGKMKEGLFGFGLEESTGGAGGYGFYPEPAQKQKDIREADMDENLKKRILDAAAFWNENCTDALNWKAAPELQNIIHNKAAGGGPRLAGVYLDYDKLLTLGLPGLRAVVSEKKTKASAIGGESLHFFEGMEMALDYFAGLCRIYREQAERLSLKETAAGLSAILLRKPENLREAIQLFYLYALASGVVNYGRMDVFLGDFYARDIDNGTLTEDSALELLIPLWQMIADRSIVFNGRIIIGGKGRRNEANADRFALAAMEASRRVVETEPQLTLRFYEGQNPELMKKALDVIGEGRIYPMLYNDDVNVPAVQKSFGIPEEEAEQYLPYGCGEYAIDHTSLSSPNCNLNTLMVLEAVLQENPPERFKTFEDLLCVYEEKVEFFADALAKRHVYEYKTEREGAAFLLQSALFGDCLEKGVSMVNGGAKYLGGICESFGNTNTGDSLAAVKKLVYLEKKLTLKQLVEILDANFEGFDTERKMMLDVPKYGNDDEETDAIVAGVNAHIGKACINAGKKAGLHHFLVVNINNEGNVTFGYRTGASADGRKSGEPLANGNTPTAGKDTKGPTAFLNSIVKIDPCLHAGYVQNMKFSKEMFTSQRALTETLLLTYFRNGGTQAMITVLSRGDLEKAMEEPVKYQNLIVRVGGFSARFVTLSRDLQTDIIIRTHY